MDAIIHSLGLYLLALVPQLRLLSKSYENHIGVMTQERLAGRGLGEIFFAHFGVSLTFLIISLQYDLFGRNVRAIKLCNILLGSLQAPLVYAFMLAAGAQPVAALMGGALFALSYALLPSTLNMLVQPEHFELLATLSGAVLALNGWETSQWTVFMGGLLMGLAPLIKLPALASIWVVSWLVLAKEGPESRLALLSVGYLLPTAGFWIALAFRNQRARSKREKTGGRESRILSGEGSLDMFLGKLKEALCSIARDGRGAVRAKLLAPMFDYLTQMGPIICLACVYVAGDGPGIGFWAWGLGICALILPARVHFCYNFSISVVLCGMAGQGAVNVLSWPVQEKAILVGGLALLVVVAVWSVVRDPNRAWIYRRENGLLLAWIEKLREALDQSALPGQRMLINISSPYHYLHTMFGLPLYRETPFLAYWCPDHMRLQMPIFERRLAQDPLQWVLANDVEPSLFDISWLEEKTGATYSEFFRSGQFLLLRAEFAECSADGLCANSSAAVRNETVPREEPPCPT